MFHRFRGVYRFSTLNFLKGTPEYVQSQDVQLRGVHIKGRFNDLPSMLFFPEMCDPVESWIPFFTDPQNKVLNFRNVYVLNPRNFGNSDRNISFDIEDIANDVVRFMWQHKITMATLAGHGFGGKVALATGCYHSERSTGVMCLDTAPMDHRHFEAFKEFQTYIQRLSKVDLNRTRGEIDKQIKEIIECPKWRSIFLQNIKKSSKGEGLEWAFELTYLQKNLKFNQSDSVGNWPVKCGLYSGRANFLFPEFSRWVHLGTNTLPMLKICPRLKGFGHDIFSLQGDENTLNHWMYEDSNSSFTLSRRMTRFLQHYDGVHVLLKDRSEIGKEFIPDRKFSRNDPNHVYSDYSPAHFHHNWRFNDVYSNKPQ